MTNLSSLQEHITKDDHHAFLKAYMKLVLEDRSLPYPVSEDAVIVKNSWENTIKSIDMNYSETFLTHVTQYWMRVLREQGGKVSQDFPQTLLQIMENRKNKPSNTRSEVSLDESEWIDTKISHNYLIDKTARSESFSIDELKEKMAGAILKGNSDDFLYFYLLQAFHDIKPQLPLSTILQTIQIKWLMLLKDKDIENRDIFIKSLTNQWFYLVNAHYIPTTKTQILELAYHLKQRVNNRG